LKFLDLAVAALIGFGSVAAMGVWNPEQLSAQGTLYSKQASMQEYLETIPSRLGLPWLQQASPDAICSALLPFSNLTIQVSASGRDFVCTVGPPANVPSASIVLMFPRGNLSLSAWQPERQ
jgi:hypothetical protein